MAKSKLLLAIDGGGTNTQAVLATPDLKPIASRTSGASNYQSIGIHYAKKNWHELLHSMLAQAGLDRHDVELVAGLGLAGLDRDKDYQILSRAISEVFGEIPYRLINDTFLILRAGSASGYGVAVVSGTGANAVGRNRQGKQSRIGGFGPEFGDFGGAGDIGQAAIRAAFRAKDGRGPKTCLEQMIVSQLRLGNIYDLVDYYIVGTCKRLSPAMLAPLVFDAAAEGDIVAIGILVEAGIQLGISAKAVARKLFSTEETFSLVMGGSVLQKGKTQHLTNALLRTTRMEFPKIKPILLDVLPVFGAVLTAAEEAVKLGWRKPITLDEFCQTKSLYKV